jgi:ribosomal protein L22
MADKDEKQAEEEVAEETAAPEAAASEEKPKPKRRSRAKKPPAAETAKAEEAKEEAAAEEAEAEAAEAEGEPEAEDETAQPKTTARRRRGGEATAGRSQPAPARKPRRDADADVTVRARARYVRHAPRKARLVIDHIRGKDVDQARAILSHTPRAASRDVLKLLDSAIANAENNHDLVADDLKIGKAYVDEGPTLKRYRPRALGRATRIRKRTSHMTIELVSKE